MRKRVPEAGDWDYEAVHRMINNMARTRQYLDLTQVDIALASGYAQSGVSGVESMRVPLVSLLTVVRLYRAMGLEIDIVTRPMKEHTDAAEAWKRNPS